MEKSSIGDFEQLLLLAILRLRENAYGTEIKREIEERADRVCSFGALYTTLERLEDKGFISSRLGEATPERGGRAKKYFKVEAAGSMALSHAYRATINMAEGIEHAVLEGIR